MFSNIMRALACPIAEQSERQLTAARLRCILRYSAEMSTAPACSEMRQGLLMIRFILILLTFGFGSRHLVYKSAAAAVGLLSAASATAEQEIMIDLDSPNTLSVALLKFWGLKSGNDLLIHT